MHNGSVSLEISKDGNGDTSDGAPAYAKIARRASDLTSRNGGWSRFGMQKYKNDLYKKAKGDRVADNGMRSRQWCISQ
jgi:hypothetical protein